MINPAIGRSLFLSEASRLMKGCENKNAATPDKSTVNRATIRKPSNWSDWEISSTIEELLYKVWMTMYGNSHAKRMDRPDTIATGQLISASYRKRTRRKRKKFRNMYTQRATMASTFRNISPSDALKADDANIWGSKKSLLMSAPGN